MRKVIVFVNDSIDGLIGSRAGHLGRLIDDEVDHDLAADGHFVIYLVETRATVGLKPRFDTLRASFTMLILENSGRLVMVFPLQSPRNAKATSSSDSRFRAAA